MAKKIKEPHNCVSCGKNTAGQKILFGICIDCQDFVLRSRAKEYRDKQQEAMAPEYDKMNDLRNEIKKERTKLKEHKQALELVKLIKEIK